MRLKVPPQIATGFSDRLQGSFERWLFYRAGNCPRSGKADFRF